MNIATLKVIAVKTEMTNVHEVEVKTSQRTFDCQQRFTLCFCLSSDFEIEPRVL